MPLFPRPFIKYIPKLFQKDEKAIALADFIDGEIDEWEDDVKAVLRTFRPDQTGSYNLEDLGQFFQAGMKESDSETIKRRKLRDAVKSHKNRNTFQGGTFGDITTEGDVKPKIDNITGLSPGARIVNSVGTDAWVLVGDVDSNPPGYLWGSMQGDALTTDLGLHLIGAGTETEVKGNIFIDLHEGVTTAVLTSDQIESIIEDLSDSLPSYMIIHLGYVDGSGVFIDYPGGVIG